MLRTIESSSVDADTAAYLRGIQRNGGRGAAGLYLSGKKPNAGLYALLGIILLPLFLWIGYTTNKPAWANALIQTAGLMLGGWFLLAALRLTIFSGKSLGNFFYFDHSLILIYHLAKVQLQPIQVKFLVIAYSINCHRLHLKLNLWHVFPHYTYTHRLTLLL